MKGCHDRILSICETCFTDYPVAISQASLGYTMGVKDEKKNNCIIINRSYAAVSYCLRRY